MEAARKSRSRERAETTATASVKRHGSRSRSKSPRRRSRSRSRERNERKQPDFRWPIRIGGFIGARPPAPALVTVQSELCRCGEMGIHVGVVGNRDLGGICNGCLCAIMARQVEWEEKEESDDDDDDDKRPIRMGTDHHTDVDCSICFHRNATECTCCGPCTGGWHAYCPGADQCACGGNDHREGSTDVTELCHLCEDDFKRRGVTFPRVAKSKSDSDKDTEE